MSSDPRSLFGGQMGQNQPSHLDQSNNRHFIESPTPSQQTNRTLSSSRYDFAASSGLTPGNDPGSSRAALPPIGWTERAQTGSSTSTSRTRLQRQIQSLVSDQVTPLRLAGHLSVLLVAATILLLSRLDLSDWNIALSTVPGSLQASELSPPNGGLTAERASIQVATDSGLNDSLQRAAVPFTIVPERGREKIEVYHVEAGDTVLGIAEKYGLYPETIQWSNPGLEANPDLLRIGDELRILPINGLVHTVKAGDTLSSIATKYKTSVDEIVGYIANDIENAAGALAVGNEIVVPGGSKPYIARQVTAYSGPIPSNAFKGSGVFTWPASGSITQRHWSGHPAIDVGSWTGAGIKASDSGYVVAAGGGWNGGYGNHVVIDHGNGFTTLYAHLNTIFVRAGENVSRGEQIGTAGNTGNSTGPHLHFEIRYQGAAQNPFSYLP